MKALRFCLGSYACVLILSVLALGTAHLAGAWLSLAPTTFYALEQLKLVLLSWWSAASVLHTLPLLWHFRAMPWKLQLLGSLLLTSAPAVLYLVAAQAPQFQSLPLSLSVFVLPSLLALGVGTAMLWDVLRRFAHRAKQRGLADATFLATGLLCLALLPLAVNTCLSSLLWTWQIYELLPILLLGATLVAALSRVK